MMTAQYLSRSTNGRSHAGMRFVCATRVVLGALLGLPVVTALPVLAGRPLAIDDAEPAAPGRFELEAGLGYVGDHTTHHFDFPLGLTYSLLPRLEVALALGGQMEEREEMLGEKEVVTGLGDLILGAKAKVLTANRFWADQALSFAAKFPTAPRYKDLGTGETDFDLTWIASKLMGVNWRAPQRRPHLDRRRCRGAVRRHPALRHGVGPSTDGAPATCGRDIHLHPTHG